VCHAQLAISKNVSSTTARLCQGASRLPRRIRGGSRLSAQTSCRSRDAKAVKSVVEKFGNKYGATDVKKSIRVVEGGRGLGLPLKTAESLRIVGEFVGKELQGHVATELKVFRLVHNTHAPAADPAEDAVMGDRLPDGLGRNGHWKSMLGVD
jgi:hypothetical protein